MTDFVTSLRHYCRNPRCRSKLPEPVANPRDAFCARGCFQSFYLRRCLVCEGPLTRKRENQRVCRKPACHATFRADQCTSRYLPSSRASKASKTLDSIGLKQAPKRDRRPVEHWSGTWTPLHVVAGPPISAESYYGACVGAGQALAECDRQNELHHKAAKAGKHGYRRTDRKPKGAATDSPPTLPDDVTARRLPIPDDLSIPTWLRRPTPETPLAIAA